MSGENDFWGGELAKAFEKANPAEPRTGTIGLPAPHKIHFSGNLDCITINMTQKAIVANLQTNESAFEAWSLALVVWCGVKKVVLNWQPPEEGCSETDQCHYQRFLYRAHQFSKLFADWFHLARSTEGARALDVGPFSLNVPGRRSETLSDEDASRQKAEAVLERRLLSSSAFKAHFNLDEGKLGRQFPVGLFDGPVQRDRRIFTGGKSAIDLVGIAGDTLVVFELKARKSNPAGILSELIFYACVMRDAIPGPKGRKARFQFDSRKRGVNTADRLAHVSSCKRIKAVLLGERLHPLIGHPNMVQRLNQAAAALHRTDSTDQVPIEFAAVTLCPAGQDYIFTDRTTGQGAI